MKQNFAVVSLRSADLDWKALTRTVERTGIPIWLEVDGAVRGVLLPRTTARELIGDAPIELPDVTAPQAAAKLVLQPVRDVGVEQIEALPAAVPQIVQQESTTARQRRWIYLACWFVAIAVLILFFSVYDQLLPNPLRVGWNALPVYFSTIVLQGGAIGQTHTVLRDHLASFATHLLVIGLGGLVVREYLCISRERLLH